MRFIRQIRNTYFYYRLLCGFGNSKMESLVKTLAYELTRKGQYIYSGHGLRFR